MIPARNPAITKSAALPKVMCIKTVKKEHGVSNKQPQDGRRAREQDRAKFFPFKRVNRDRSSVMSPYGFSKLRIHRRAALGWANAMKTGFLLIAAFVLALHPSFDAEAGGPQSKIAFERGSNVWIANIDGTKARKLIKGDDPRIAPDGTKVAFTMTPPGNKDVERYIAVVDVETAAAKIFKDMPSDNCFGAVWSPNGSQILFEIFVDSHWRLGLVNADGSGFQLFKTPFREQGWSSPCWAPDAKSIFVRISRTSAALVLTVSCLRSGRLAKQSPKVTWIAPNV